MPQIRLVLADSDQLFLEKFSAYLKNSKTTPFVLELFTNPTIFSQWLERGGAADLMVISSSFLAMLENPPTSERPVMVLCDSHENMVPTGYTLVHKYQPAENLMGEILSACAEGIPGSYRNKRCAEELHLVLYADGSEVLNPLAPSLACVKAQSGQSTFYLSLDPLSDTHTYFNGNNSRGFSEFLYYIKSQKDNLLLKAEACTSRDVNFGVDFMKSRQNPQDMAGLTPSEVKSILDALRDRAVYSHIIVSRAFQFDELLHVLMTEAQKVYLACLNHPLSCNRVKLIAHHFLNNDNALSHDLQKKILCCITMLHHEDQPLSAEIPFEKAYLPFSPYHGHDFFPPSGEYLQALETISALERG